MLQVRAQSTPDSPSLSARSLHATSPKHPHRMYSRHCFRSSPLMAPARRPRMRGPSCRFANG